jgi:two-component system OmpR family response regulator
MARLLVVEDEPRMAGLLHRGLTQQGYDVTVAADAKTARAAVLGAKYDAIVCDVMLPDESGIEWCRWVRSAGFTTPILILTARTDVRDRIAGLHAGADDYLGKPFAFGELAARILALLRRTRTRHPTELSAGRVTLDALRHEVRVDGLPIELAPREYTLLEFLLRRRGQAVTRLDILDSVWDMAYDGSSNVVDVTVATLRRKLRAHEVSNLITTVRGVGYRLDAPP